MISISWAFLVVRGIKKECLMNFRVRRRHLSSRDMTTNELMSTVTVAESVSPLFIQSGDAMPLMVSYKSLMEKPTLLHCDVTHII